MAIKLMEITKLKSSLLSYPFKVQVIDNKKKIDSH